MINARSEGVTEKPAFHTAFAKRRCLIPADGFYEWTGPKGKRRPFFLRPREGGLIAFAGLWERWRDNAGQQMDTVAILTCPANTLVAELHDRMPVILPPERFVAWLDCEKTSPEAAQAMLLPTADGFLESIEMHPKINDSRRDEPGLQEPLQTRLL